MRYCKPEQILKAIPEARTILIPDDWFDHLTENVTVFTSLYKWMIEKQGVPAEDFNHLHNLTFASQKTHNRLLAAEKRRIARYRHLKGQALQNAVNMTNLNSGPQALFAKKEISGDVLIVFPSSVEDKISSAQNLLSDKEVKNQNRRIYQLASGSNFSQWLFSNSERDDLVGDLAKDAMGDNDFPKSAKHHEDVREYLEFRGAGALEALNDAWLEYTMQYPNRIIQVAWCEYCGKQISDLLSGLLVWTKEDGFHVFHSDCLSDNTGSKENLRKLLIECSDFINLDKFAQKCTADSKYIEEIKGRLILWGWGKRSSAKISRIYFIQSGSSGPIKIGYSTSSVKDRLATLQTAHHEKLNLLATMEGARPLEQKIHSQFQSHRLEGEWFHPDPGILNFIDDIKKNSKL